MIHIQRIASPILYSRSRNFSDSITLLFYLLQNKQVNVSKRLHSQEDCVTMHLSFRTSRSKESIDLTDKNLGPINSTPWHYITTLCNYFYTLFCKVIMNSLNQ